jgi:hypothetical protein
MDTTSVLDSQIANYFKDQQEKRNKKQISGTTTEPQEELMKNKSKSIYMKQYMQKRRKDKNFRSKERVKERDGKQLAREDEPFFYSFLTSENVIYSSELYCITFFYSFLTSENGIDSS